MFESSSLPQEEKKMLQRIPVEIILLSLIGGLAVAFLFNTMTGLFVLAGGIFSAVSFSWLKSSLSRFLGYPNKNKMLRSVLVSYLLRLLLIIAVFSIIIILFSRKIFAFMAGFSIIILVILGETVGALSRMKTWKK